MSESELWDLRGLPAGTPLVLPVSLQTASRHLEHCLTQLNEVLSRVVDVYATFGAREAPVEYMVPGARRTERRYLSSLLGSMRDLTRLAEWLVSRPAAEYSPEAQPDLYFWTALSLREAERMLNGLAVSRAVGQLACGADFELFTRDWPFDLAATLWPAI